MTIPFPVLSQTTRANSSTIIQELLELTVRPEVISFAGGLPSPEGFPIEAVRQASDKVLREQGAAALQYSMTEGCPALRHAIADFETARGVETTPEEVQIVTGSQQALDLAARVFLDPGAPLLVENPTYMGALQAFQLVEPEFRTIATDEEGLVPEAMGEECRGARFAYVMPTFANPTGRTLSNERRIALAEKARELDLWILEDDPYGELWYEEKPGKSLRAFAPERTLRLGTLSKVLSPGLRLGYICGPKDVITEMMKLKQCMDLHTSTFTQLVAAEILSSGALEEHLPSVRAIYKRQAHVMLEALEEFMPEGVIWTRAKGGMFLWVDLPETIDTAVMMRECVEAGVAFVPGSAFYADGRKSSQMRLSFVTVPEEKIIKGVKILAEVTGRHL